MSTVLTGPADGRWVRVSSEQRRVYLKCGVCDALVTEGWKYYVDITSHADVCLACADALTNNEEATMAGTAGVTADMLGEISLALEGAVLDWETGKATSPDTRDYVLIAERVLTDRLGGEYLWLSDATHESVAEALYEAQCDGRIDVYAEMAEWLATAITVGHEGEAS